MQAPTTVIDAVLRAKEIFHRNCDTLIAGFLVRHPNVDPADIEIVLTPMPSGVLRFSIEPKELHVPPAMNSERYDDSVDEYYEKGWNACREAMIDQAKGTRAPEAMVSTLEAVNVGS